MKIDITLRLVNHSRLRACEARAKLTDWDGCFETEIEVGEGSTQLEAIIDALYRLSLTKKINFSEICSISIEE